jgi:hypothetical protein
LGKQLDKEDVISISLENVWTQSESYSNYVSGYPVYTTTFQPDLMSASLNYYRYIFFGKGARTYLTIGGGYYHAVIGYVSDDPNLTDPNVSATFTGDILGGTLGVGQEIAIGNSFRTFGTWSFGDF